MYGVSTNSVSNSCPQQAARAAHDGCGPGPGAELGVQAELGQLLQRGWCRDLDLGFYREGVGHGSEDEAMHGRLRSGCTLEVSS